MTQETQPKKGKPIEIPIPDRDQVLADFRTIALGKDETMTNQDHTTDVEARRYIEAPTDEEVEQIRRQLNMSDTPRDIPNPPPDPQLPETKDGGTPEKKRRIRRVPQAKPELTRTKVLRALEAMGGEASLVDLTKQLFGGKYNSRFRNRVYYHAKRLANDGILRQVGTASEARYKTTGKPFSEPEKPPSKSRSKSSKTSKQTVSPTVPSKSDSDIGALFEIVGKIGDSTAVRSLDTHQLYKLENL